MTYPTSIDYEALLQSALKQMMGNVLTNVSDQGLPGDHHFYIGFYTQYEGVEISDRIEKDYPEEMVIVLRHQFENLIVEDTHFSLDLFFSGIRESLKVPFDAVTRFEDPSANFALQFTQAGAEMFSDDDDLNSLEDELIEEDFEHADNASVTKFPRATTAPSKAQASPAEVSTESEPAETVAETAEDAISENTENKVVSLDQFRKS